MYYFHIILFLELNINLIDCFTGNRGTGLPIGNLYFIQGNCITTYHQVDGCNLATLKLERSAVVVDEILAAYYDSNLLNAILRDMMEAYCLLAVKAGMSKLALSSATADGVTTLVR